MRYVILTEAPTDYSSRDEAALIRSGRSGLLPVFRAPNLTVYEVPAARSIITGPGRPRVLSLSDTRDPALALQAGTLPAGRSLLPLLERAAAPVSQTTGDNMTELVSPAPA